MNLLFALIASVTISMAAGLCCPWHPTEDIKCACDDGELVHPWECCSVGDCNVFCCNCDGECRKNTTGLDETAGLYSEDAMIELYETEAAEDEEEDWDLLFNADRLTPTVQMLGRSKK
ncbi:uncharacterized protein LOC111701537 isoform X2 [Eurytemora carolleeae]|uniref:uncharacterized protein LOC111701537 isoform X2 n=1 Tax=Eurytemora carolleeae TaxID=1294199 RepID=UPI000C76A99C|nr:uncharacterized protein LOC111701537 isoform X2 [Eurytemora carolleeae]|eukprot:XP_023328621.1 uncharacterized protein LOC111701537 isoform X2 [Eurytemora affinis]